MIIENVIKADVCKNKSANAVGFSLIDDNVALHHLNKRQKKSHSLGNQMTATLIDLLPRHQ